jgi:2-dehydro-3-deoxyglucarate aldolase/4-hydroxy-2-oxoheptanedioate aldolase
MNPVKEKLRSGGVAIGQIVLDLFAPGIGPMLAAAGMEFVIYDMEHGRCDIQLLEQMAISCRGTEIVPLARVPDLNYAPLSRLLDVGVRGVMIPRVETGQQMLAAVRALKYAPEGNRGVALGVAHDLYRSGGAAYLPQANQDTLVIAIIETVTALENIEEIVSTPGLDVAWMGHYDLTVSMGIPAQFDNPRFLEAMSLLVETSTRHGVAAGFMTAGPEDAIKWIDQGFRAISLGSDVMTIVNTLSAHKAQVLRHMDQRKPGTATFAR